MYCCGLVDFNPEDGGNMPLREAGNPPTGLQHGYPEDRNKCGRCTLNCVEPDLFCFHFVHFKSQFK
jgi:hypothetical protein